MKNKFALIAFTTFALSACGGSDSNNSAVSPPIPPPAPITGPITALIDNPSVQIFGTSQVQAGGAVGFAVIPKASRQIDSITWQQLSGPALTFLASNSQTIGFDVPSSGNYSLSANVKMQGESQLTNYTVNFSAESGQAKAAVRLDHTASELAKVSLHVGVPSNKTIQTVSWTQLAGPQAQNVQEQDDFLFFNAPSVSSDSVILYRANVSYTDGTSDIDDVLVTVKNIDLDVNSLFYRSNNQSVITEDMHAYKVNSPYKEALERCVYGNYIPNPPTCTLRELPVIGMQITNPSVDDILNRTLVSHTWMGDRFADFLQNSIAGPDMLSMLRGVTAVIISYDVRPSFYWQATGAIYLDANNFWQTPEERDTLNDQPDRRTDFGSDLQFSVFWRYTKDNDYYPAARITKQDRVARDFADLEASISWLMYHELAHANDFIPPSAWASVNPNTTPFGYISRDTPQSDELSQLFPLRSSEMHALAQVRFNNATPTSVERNYRGGDVETFFTPDISPSFYSYFTKREDFATLVERYMMLYRFDAHADVAIIDGRTASDEPLVVWGQRNRISEDSLEDRTVFAVSRVYPELGNIRPTLQSLPEPLLMQANRGWFENLVLSPVPAGPVTNTVLSRSLEQVTNGRPRFSEAEMKVLEQQDSGVVHKGPQPLSN